MSERRVLNSYCLRVDASIEVRNYDKMVEELSKWFDVYEVGNTVFIKGCYFIGYFEKRESEKRLLIAIATYDDMSGFEGDFEKVVERLRRQAEREGSDVYVDGRQVIYVSYPNLREDELRILAEEDLEVNVESVIIGGKEECYLSAICNVVDLDGRIALTIEAVPKFADGLYMLKKFEEILRKVGARLSINVNLLRPM